MNKPATNELMKLVNHDALEAYAVDPDEAVHLCAFEVLALIARIEKDAARLEAAEALIGEQHRALYEVEHCRYRKPCEGCDERIPAALASFTTYRKTYPEEERDE